MEEKFTNQRLSIKNIELWYENARFPDTFSHSNEIDLINFFVSKPEFKIRLLIDEIAKDYDLPQLEKIIIWETNGKYIVLEGNRRVTAYKLIANPKLSVDKEIVKVLEEYKNKLKITNDFQLECLITKEKEEGLRFIDRKHLNNNNEVNWQDVERAQYRVRRGSKVALELQKINISKVVRNLDLPDEMKEQVLGKKHVTNFFRFVNSSPAKEKYGISFDEKGDFVASNKNFNEELKVIVHNVLAGQDFDGNKINSRSLNKTQEIKKYIDSISKNDVKKVEESILKNTSQDIFGDETIAIQKKSKKIILKKSTNRDYLIPNSFIVKIPENKINNIFLELRNDLLLDNSNEAVPNAVGVLFRVFLEISIDYFLEKQGINLSKDTKLAGKITKCADKLEEMGLATNKQLKNIRKVATDNNNILAIQNFHDYVHSYKDNPCSNDLKSRWDNLEEFFKILWD